MASAWGKSWGSAWGNAWGLATQIIVGQVFYGGGLSTKYNRQQKKKLKRLVKLTEEIESIREELIDEVVSLDSKEQNKADSLKTYEALIKDAIRKELDGSLEINEIQYAKTKQIIEGIVRENNEKLILEEEEVIAMMIIALFEFS